MFRPLAIAGYTTVAIIALAGCAPRHRLEASWFAVDAKERPAIFVAVLNRDRGPVDVYDTAVNVPPRRWVDTPTPLKTLAPGQIFLRPIAPISKAGAEPDCSLPVRIFVKTGPKQRQIVPVEIKKAMPAAFPDWLETGGCRLQPTP